MYETGLFVAFCLWAFHAVNLIVATNSTMNKNLNRVGMRVAWLTLQPVPLTSEHKAASTASKAFKYVLLQLAALPFILLSWVYVALSVGMFIYGKTKDSGKPQAYRELAWKMRNVDMSFDELMKEMAKSRDLTEAETVAMREQILDEMENNCLIPKRRRDSDWQDTQ